MEMGRQVTTQEPACIQFAELNQWWKRATTRLAQHIAAREAQIHE
jgi:hypothetical protein